MLQRAFISSFWAAIVFLSAFGAAYAQTDTLTAINSDGPVPSGGAIPGPGEVLWDNTAINNTTAGIVSTAFSSLPADADRTNTADDFIVPAGEQWSVEFVYSEGFTNLVINADSFEVVFYENDGGQPGAVIDSQTVPFGAPVTMTTQEITLPNPVNLGPGTYWVSVIGVYDTGTTLAEGRWNWSTGPTAIGSEWFLQDTAGFFGGIPWTPASGLGIDDVSALFALRGSIAAGPLPPPATTAVPVLDSFGLMMLAMLLMLVAMVGIARRTQ